MKGYRATPGSHTYRRYGTLSGHAIWLVGYNEQYATHFNESFLWVGGPMADMRDHEPSLEIEANPISFYALGKEILFPLPVPSKAAREPVI